MKLFNFNINQYVKYWNHWHLEWGNFIHLPINNNPLAIQVNNCSVKTEWPILDSKGGYNQSTHIEPSWKFFPEPYWGIPDSDNLFGVFINFNPGEGVHGQHIDTYKDYLNIKPQKQSCHRIWEKYSNSNYYDTIKGLYKESDYITTNWMIKNRETFIKNFYNEFYHGTTIEGDFVMFELCPWHTKSVNSKVSNYIKTNSKLIDEYIIDFAFESAKKIKGCFKNIIISHGLDQKVVENSNFSLKHIDTEEIQNDKNGKRLKKTWTIDIFSKNESNIYILNFKNSSNGFPVITNELNAIIEKYSCKIN